MGKETARVATLTSKSQITIPAEVRRRLGIGPGDRVVLEVEGERAILRPLRGGFTERSEGLGRAVWAREGGAAAYLESERGQWEGD
ncbi:MAG: AbrB/MazE/SpoVT family DNA-binding domain-containing protein [Nitrospirae bacterium]|nr:MAG: AbrB/MazE/SpoVT family DNA-binding domain-containing protein [Nitrospirota bacterium]